MNYYVNARLGKETGAELTSAILATSHVVIWGSHRQVCNYFANLNGEMLVMIMGKLHLAKLTADRWLYFCLICVKTCTTETFVLAYHTIST